ncbi:MAG: helix-turn-helix domain-containing protein [Phycisphaeraceae bacterium]
MNLRSPARAAPEADPAPALGRGLALLRRLESDGPLSLERLAAVTGWPKSSVARLLRSLELAGIVAREPATRRYRPLVRLVDAAPAGDRLAAAWAEHAGPLAERLGQTLEWYRFDGQGLVMIDRREPETAVVSVRARIGFRRTLDEFDALTQTALAFGLPQRQWPRRAMWAWINGTRCPVSRAKVRDHVRDVQRHGTAVDLGVNEHSVRRYALAVCDPDRALTGVIAVAQVCSPNEAQPRRDLLEQLHPLRDALAPPTRAASMP